MRPKKILYEGDTTGHPESLGGERRSQVGKAEGVRGLMQHGAEFSAALANMAVRQRKKMGKEGARVDPGITTLFWVLN